MDTFLRRCHVTKDYQASHTDPFSVQAHELFHVSEKVDFWNGNPDWIWIWCTDPRGKSGWVPKKMIHTNSDNATASTSSAYSALELTITTGDELEVVEEESGWLWCVDQQGNYGWVPLEHVTWLL
jgi:SH3-like domain-containing protein